ncbi:MAG: flagellar biosynthetic protein FliQ [bacterium]|nr:flagellar biosynthetic protein FliQ [bacterium]
METADIIAIGQELILTAILLSMPTVVTSLTVGLIFAILQTVTSVQEQTLSFAPRIVAVGAVLLIALPWTLNILVNFTHRMLWRIAEVTQ